MRFIGKYGSRKYLLRILLTVSIFAVVVSTVSGWAIYVNSEKTVLKIQEEANAKVLTQVNFNIDYMHEMIRNLAVSLFFDSESVYLLNRQQMDKSDFYLKMMRIEKIANTTTFLDSILIYNKHTNCYYSTRFTLGCPDDGVGGLVDRYLQEYDPNVPKLKLIPLYSKEPQDSTAYIDLLSYMMYEQDTVGEEASKLILNVKPEWLFENINSINELGEQANNGTFILDREGVSFQAGKELPFNMAEIAMKTREQREQSGLSLSTFVLYDGGKKWIVTYKDSETNNWLTVTVQDYTEVFAETYKMRTVAIGFLLVFIVLALLASLGASVLLYRPMNRMLAQIGGLGSSDKASPFLTGDEFSYISAQYRRALEGMDKMRKEKEYVFGDLKTFVLRRLLTDSTSVSLQELNGATENGRIRVDVSNPMLIVLFQLDIYGRDNNRIPQSEKRLYKFAAGNIASEIVSHRFANEVVDMRNAYLVLLLNIGDGNVEQELLPMLQEIQDYMLTHYHISLTVSLSDSIPQLYEVAKQYGRAQERAKYRFVYGKQSIITSEMVKENRGNVVFDFPSEIDKRLQESIKLVDSKLFDAQLVELTRYIGNLHYDDIVYMLLHIISILNYALREINQNGMSLVDVDLKAYYHLIIEKETWEEAQQSLKELFNDIAAIRKNSSTGDTNLLLVDTIKEMIEDRYPDPNLSLQLIASMLKMSTAHISKIFREKENKPISEYITDIRLDHARLLLETSDYTVNEIMERIGFSNQSYFFRLFKKKFGVTPKEYRTKKVVL